MAKFEYKYLAVNHNKDVWEKHIEVLNNQGKDEWELVSAIYPISEKATGSHPRESHATDAASMPEQTERYFMIPPPFSVSN